MAEKEEDSLIGYDPLAWMHRADFDPHMQSDKVVALESQHAKAVASSAAETLGPEMDQDQTSGIASASSAGEAGERGILVLESVLNIQNVAVLHQRLIQMLSSSDVIDIDASNVTMIDTATLQLLLILKQTAIGIQKSITIDFPSDKFIAAAELLGIAEMLEVDQAASGFF